MSDFRSPEAAVRLQNVLPHVETPLFVLDEQLLEANLKILKTVKERSGAKIYLALKGFAMWKAFPLIREYLDGVCASSPHEAKLGKEEFGKEVCTFGAAYSDTDFVELTKTSDHIIFNSFRQWQHFKKTAPANIDYGIRVNPGYAEIDIDAYNPCVLGSRLGVPSEHFQPELLEGISGLHFHALCGQGAETLEKVVANFEERFGKYLHQMQWLNMGGGHYITEPGYNIDLLCQIITRLQTTYGLQIMLEPGEAVVLDTGYLLATVLDTIENGMPIAILDVSAQAHVPDIIGSNYQYRPEIIGASKTADKPHTWRLGGPTCLAGDSFGDYSFDAPLVPGQKLVFPNMMQYNMVQATTFNGIKLPDIAILRKNGELEVVRKFGYEDFKGRNS